MARIKLLTWMFSSDKEGKAFAEAHRDAVQQGLDNEDVQEGTKEAAKWCMTTTAGLGAVMFELVGAFSLPIETLRLRNV